MVNHEQLPIFRALGPLAPFPETLLAKTRDILNIDGADRAERFQAWVCHEFIDNWWCILSKYDRKVIAWTLREVLIDPAWLLEKADVDVIRGLVKRRYGPEHGYLESSERWEPEPTLPKDYQRLCAFLKSRIVEELI